MFSRESWCLVSTLRGEYPFLPCRRPMVRSDDKIFLKNFGKMHRFWSLESRSRTSSLESWSRSFWWSLCLEILSRSRSWSRRLRSRLHHWLLVVINMTMLIVGKDSLKTQKLRNHKKLNQEMSADSVDTFKLKGVLCITRGTIPALGFGVFSHWPGRSLPHWRSFWYCVFQE